MFNAGPTTEVLAHQAVNGLHCAAREYTHAPSESIRFPRSSAVTRKSQFGSIRANQLRSYGIGTISVNG
jgi:hypothetical protein